MKNKNKNKYITLREYKRLQKVNSMAYAPKVSIVNRLVGIGFIVVGGVTLPLPTGSIFLIGIGLFLLTSPFNLYKSLLYKINDIRQYVKNKLTLWGLL